MVLRPSRRTSDTDQPSIRDYLVASEIDELIRTSRHAVVVGIGNVALDVARVLIKTVEELDDTDMADEVLESLARKNITDVCSVAAGPRTRPSPPKSFVRWAAGRC